jgi:hypothetical protein
MNHYVLGFVFMDNDVLLQKAKTQWMNKRWNAILSHEIFPAHKIIPNCMGLATTWPIWSLFGCVKS